MPANPGSQAAHGQGSHVNRGAGGRESAGTQRVASELRWDERVGAVSGK
jgi:hypothetical protein